MVTSPIMARADSRSKMIGELIDEIERIREDLLRLQRELEKMENSRMVRPLTSVKKIRLR
jgi:F0F1-type ATP synthase membrane subunit b/b'